MFAWCQPPLREPSSQEETTSLGSRTRKIIRLSGSACMSNGAPTDPGCSLTTR
jgi:hypothetical protein